MPTKARKPKQPTPPVVYTGATILPGESVQARFAWSSKDAALVARCSVGTMATIVGMNATTCAQQVLRLYRKAGNGAGKSMWRGKRVTDRKRLAYLRDTGKLGPGVKAASYASETDEIEEVLDHPAAVLIRRPDPTMTGEAWHRQHFWFTEAAGRVYGLIERAGKFPVAIYHLFPQYTRVVPSQTTLIGGYVYGRNTTAQRVFQPDEVIYYRPFHSGTDPLGAWCWPETMQMEADFENAAMTSENARWSNGGQPGMVVVFPPGTTETQFKQAIAGINGQIKGVLNAGKVLGLVNAKTEPVGQKPVDMNFQQGMEHVVAKMYRAGGVPDGMWKQGSAALANAEQADPLYMGGTITPRLQLAAAEHTDFLLPMFDIEPGEMWFAYDKCVADDRAAMVKEAVDLVAAGVTTPECQAKKLGYAVEDVPARGPMESMLITDVESTDVPDPLALPEGDAAPVVAASQGSLQQEALNGAQTQALAALATQAANGELPVATARAIAQASNPLLSPEALDGIFGPLANFTPKPADVGGDGTVGGAGVGDGDTGGDAGEGGDGAEPVGDGDATELKTVTGVEVKSADLPNQPREVDAALADLQRDLKPWYQQAMTRAVNEFGTVDLTAYLPQLHAIMGDHMPKIVDAAARDAAKEVGGTTTTLTNPKATEWAKANAAQAVTSIEDTLRTTLQQRVADGIENGQSVAEVQAQIMKDAPEFSAARAELIAKNEVAVASKVGQNIAWKEAGVELRDFILSSGPCPKCVAAKEQNPDPIPLRDDGGAWTVDGERFIEAHFHVGCYCDEVPVLKKAGG